MGYLNDITQVARTINKSMGGLKGLATDMQKKSFAKGALDGTLQFSGLISDTIPVDMANTLGKFLERVYASFAQIYLSTNNIIDISKDRPNSFLKNFHTNYKTESTLVDLYQEYCGTSQETFEFDEELYERFYNGTTKIFFNENNNTGIVFNLNEDFNASVYESNKEQLTDYLEYLNYNPIPRVGNSRFYENNYGPVFNNIAPANDNEVFKVSKDGRVPELLKDNDVKKWNDMQPYTMGVRLMAVNDENEFVQFIDFVVGVKVILHNIKSNDMILNIGHVLQNTGKFFNFIRWTTGEKSLIKDFLLNINNARFDAANLGKGSSPWWTTLKKLRETSKAQGIFFAKTKFVPNSTLIITDYEIDKIKENYGYDLKNPAIAMRLMNKLFLMNFVILDAGTRTVDVMYDGQNSFQSYSLETFEREVTNNSNKLGRELTRLVTR